MAALELRSGSLSCITGLASAVSKGPSSAYLGIQSQLNRDLSLRRHTENNILSHATDKVSIRTIRVAYNFTVSALLRA